MSQTSIRDDELWEDTLGKVTSFTCNLKSCSISSFCWCNWVFNSSPMIANRVPETSLPLVEAEEVELRRSSSKARRRPVDTPVPWGMTTVLVPWLWWYSTFKSWCCCLGFTRRSSPSRDRFRDPNILHASSLSASRKRVLFSAGCCPWLGPATA